MFSADRLGYVAAAFLAAVAPHENSGSAASPQELPTAHPGSLLLQLTRAVDRDDVLDLLDQAGDYLDDDHARPPGGTAFGEPDGVTIADEIETSAPAKAVGREREVREGVARFEACMRLLMLERAKNVAMGKRGSRDLGQALVPSFHRATGDFRRGAAALTALTLSHRGGARFSPPVVGWIVDAALEGIDALCLLTPDYPLGPADQRRREALAKAIASELRRDRELRGLVDEAAELGLLPIAIAL